MKSQLCFFALFALLALSTPFSTQARTEEEVNNYLAQTIIPEFNVNNISAKDALEMVQKMAALNQYGIYFDIKAVEKAKKSMITLNLSNTSAYNVIGAICQQAAVKCAVKKDQIIIFEVGTASGL